MAFVAITTYNYIRCITAREMRAVLCIAVFALILKTCAGWHHGGFRMFEPEIKPVQNPFSAMQYPYIVGLDLNGDIWFRGKMDEATTRDAGNFDNSRIHNSTTGMFRKFTLKRGRVHAPELRTNGVQCPSKHVSRCRTLDFGPPFIGMM